MFKEAQLFAPLVIDAAGTPDVTFPPGHPGAGDDEYRMHRNEIAAAALAYRDGDPLPDIGYTPRDHDTWRRISAALASLHREFASTEARDAAERLALPADRVPQLSEASRRLEHLTGFTLRPAAGIVPLSEFYGSLADCMFHATQFIRHPSKPLFSPEPDMVHEVIGHGTTLASSRFAKLYRQAGEAARRAGNGTSLKAVSRVFWFTLEYGVMEENGQFMAYGASLLSAYGELQSFRGVEIRPLDVRDMVTRPYDVTSYQPVLYAAESLAHLEDFLGEFSSGVDGDTGDRLGLVPGEKW
ncbi:phenylalanine 4-monooxygenase [Streptomyces sp. NPDC048312]|uniref:Tyrosine 3-monooxygenase n=1 Tax=Streptomyces melanovinaceus TaxID=1182637 RepID=A0A0A6ZAJ4_9ACTN|nr:tyrosine 3-monooxygenase [Streptomyces melanovinaceus]